MSNRFLPHIDKKPALGSSHYWPGTSKLPVVVPEQLPAKKPRKKPRAYLSDDVRRMGIYILAGRGSGKSWLMGRGIGWQDLYRGIPQVIFDPVGSTIANLLDKVMWQPPEIQRQLWPRIKYLDMSGKIYGRVFPFPLYYRLGREDTYNDIASRYLEVIKRLEPKLQEAPVLGWNAIKKVGVPLGVVLAGLGWQITEAQELLNNPPLFADRLRELAASSNDRGLHKAVKFFTQQEDKYWRSNDWMRKKDSLETQIAMFTDDNPTMAMFGASQPALDWEEVISKKSTVLLGFRGETNREKRRFKMLWVFMGLLAYLQYRGEGRHTDSPIGLIVDEITTLYNFDSQAGSDIFAADLDDLVNVWSRNANCWLTLSHQERWQIPTEKSLHTLWSLGTKIIGNTSSQEAAEELARELFIYDPHKVKRYERVWTSNPSMFAGSLGEPLAFVIDQNPVEYTPEEQQLLNSYKIKGLGLFKFLIKPAKSEGDTTGKLRYLDVSGLDKGIFPNDQLVAEARRRLVKRDGLQFDRVLREIDQRLEQQVKLTSEPATLASDAVEDTPPEPRDEPEPSHRKSASDLPEWWEGI